MSNQNKLNYVVQIDGLRCFAVLGVLIAHFIAPEFYNSTLKKIPFGTGVNLFFVISGYLITYILLKQKENIDKGITTFNQEIKKFFIKRTLRIFPLYYTILIFLLIFSFNEIKEYVIYLASFTTNIYMTMHSTYIGNKTHLWSLAVEEQFYFMWPFLLLFVSRKWILKLVLGIILFSLCSKFYFLSDGNYIGANAFLTSCFDALGLGALLAYLQLYHDFIFKKLSNKWIVLGLIIMYAIVFIVPDLTSQYTRGMFDNFFTSIIYFFIVAIASQNQFTGLAKIILENKVTVYFGKISYGIYIIHNFMPQAFYQFFARKLPPTSDHGVRIFYWIVLTLLLSSISWFIIEKPILKLKKRFS